jgi:hypothetical protein
LQLARKLWQGIIDLFMLVKTDVCVFPPDPYYP